MAEAQLTTSRFCLEKATIRSVPATAIYIPNFISPQEEELLLQKIENAPASQWTNLSRRRLQAYPSRITSSNVLLGSPLPAWLFYPIIPRLQQLSLSAKANADKHNHVFAGSPHGAPNHVLVNEYKPGQGIMPHEDGSAYWPVVATVSLGAPIVLDMYCRNGEGQREKEPKWAVMQEARSLLITTDELYTKHLHGIEERTTDEDLGPGRIANWELLGSPEAFASGSMERKTRISLTYRDVLKVSNVGSKLRLSHRP